MIQRAAQGYPYPCNQEPLQRLPATAPCPLEKLPLGKIVPCKIVSWQNPGHRTNKLTGLLSGHLREDVLTLSLSLSLSLSLPQLSQTVDALIRQVLL